MVLVIQIAEELDFDGLAFNKKGHFEVNTSNNLGVNLKNVFKNQLSSDLVRKQVHSRVNGIINKLDSEVFLIVPSTNNKAGIVRGINAMNATKSRLLGSEALGNLIFNSAQI